VTALALLWTVLAWSNPTITYHLAPLLIASVFPIARALDRSPSIRELATTGWIGGAIAGGTTGVLGITDHLLGPSLLPFGGAVLESVVFAGLGVVVGVAIAIVIRK
jgi:hypothetical protein